MRGARFHTHVGADLLGLAQFKPQADQMASSAHNIEGYVKLGVVGALVLGGIALLEHSFKGLK